MKKVVMDVGCGTSLDILRYVDVSTFDLWIIGIDWDSYFCKKSKERAKELEIDAEYLRCDAGYLPIRDETFDTIYMLDSLRCFNAHPLQQFVEEACRKLKPNGELCVTGLDKVTYMRKDLPKFKDFSLSLNWSVHIPLDGSSPFIFKEPSQLKISAKKRYKYVGMLREKIVSELLWQYGVEPETRWETKQERDYSYHYYTILASKSK